MRTPGCGAELRSLGTVRGRVGYAVANWLPYVTGGLAFGNVSAYNNNVPASGSTTRAGWTLGVGVETMFAPNWSAKLEYLHADLGSADQYVIFSVPESVKVTADILRVGLNYRLNAVPAPLVRKY